MLANPEEFVAMIKGYDYDSMSGTTFKKLKLYATDPDETLANINAKSLTAGCVYKWVSALYNYCETRFAILGLRKRQRWSVVYEN